ncbi:MAG TPA: hypothetical protein VK968_13325 [Roseimicrobium sp.]|nr:hypothetical protein [Roseimicrobium sp.]
MTRRAIRTVLLFTLIGVCGIAYFRNSRSPKQILKRHFNVAIPAAAKDPHAFAEQMPDTIIYSVWFRAEMPVEEAKRLAAALELRPDPPAFAYNPGTTDGVRSWWMPGLDSIQRDTSSLFWSKATGNFDGGYTYATWHKERLYLFRHGIPVRR